MRLYELLEPSFLEVLQQRAESGALARLRALVGAREREPAEESRKEALLARWDI